MDYYGLDLLTHPIPDEYQPFSSRDDYHKINARLRTGHNPKWDPRFPDQNGEPGHNGDDIYALRGKPIANPFSKPAEVVNAGSFASNSLAGNLVELLIPVAGGDLGYRGLHMDTVLVTKGQIVQPGQQIGTVGDSGPPLGQPGHVRSPHSHIDIGFYPGGMNRSKGMLSQPRIELDIRIFLDRAASGGGGAGVKPLNPIEWPDLLSIETGRHPAVEAAKALLAALGIRKRVGNDFFGPGFDGEVRDFQTRAGIPSDGVIGSDTRAAIADYLNLE